MIASDGYAVLQLSTDPIPLRDRASMAREVFGRHILNLELEPNPDVALRIDFKLQAFEGLKIVHGSASGVVSRRTRAQITDSNDDLFLSMNETDVFSVSHRGRTVDMGAGEAVLTSCAEPVSFRRTHGRATGIAVPRRALGNMGREVEDLAGHLISRDNEPLRLLRNYVNSLRDESLASPSLRHIVVAHVHDLLALTLDASGDTRALAAGRGLKAARLREIKGYVAKHLSNSELSIEGVATAHQLTERYIQRLFETDGVTFSNYVSALRLARAYRILRDPRRLDQPVMLIAYECGFGDVSHFNRVFRRLYGASPTDVRAELFNGQLRSTDSQ